MNRYIFAFIVIIISIGYLKADDWSGVDYAKNSSVQLSHAERLLNSLSLNGNEQVLDVGCGDGKITALLAQKLSQGFVTGVDPSDSMLLKAQVTLNESGLKNLAFEKGAAEDFCINQRFDHIIAIHAMHWVKEQEKALKNIYNHLQTQGQVHFIIAPSKEGLPYFTALQKTLKNWHQDFEGFVNPQQVYDMETYRKLMVEAGFHIETIQYIYHESTHQNKEKLMAWLKQWQPHAKHLPIHKQSAFMDELMVNYLFEIGLDDESSRTVKWGEYVLIVEATKE